MRRGRMGVRARRLRAERMVLALLGGMGEHAAQLGARKAELALGVPVGALVPELARREGTESREKNEDISHQEKKKRGESCCRVPSSVSQSQHTLTLTLETLF